MTAMRLRETLGILTLAVLFSLQAGRSAHSQAVTDNFLAGVEVAEIADCAVVRVRLNFPVRIIGHFPNDFGNELRIRVRPLVVSREVESERPGRESLRPPLNDRAAIQQIVYWRDAVTGPTLTIYFHHPVAYEVDEGVNFRSLIIAVAGPEPSGSCRPEFPSQN